MGEGKSLRSYDDLAISYAKYAVVDSENPDKEMLRAALDIWTELNERFPDNDTFRKNKEFVKAILDMLG